MIQLLPTVPSFGQEFARALTAGLTSGAQSAYSSHQANEFQKFKQQGELEKVIIGEQLKGQRKLAEQEQLFKLLGLGGLGEEGERPNADNQMEAGGEMPTEGSEFPQNNYDSTQMPSANKRGTVWSRLSEQKKVALSIANPNLAKSLQADDDIARRQQTAEEEFAFKKESAAKKRKISRNSRKQKAV